MVGFGLRPMLTSEAGFVLPAVSGTFMPEVELASRASIFYANSAKNLGKHFADQEAVKDKPEESITRYVVGYSSRQPRQDSHICYIRPPSPSTPDVYEVTQRLGQDSGLSWFSVLQILDLQLKQGGVFGEVTEFHAFHVRLSPQRMQNIGIMWLPEDLQFFCLGGRFSTMSPVTRLFARTSPRNQPDL